MVLEGLRTALAPKPDTALAALRRILVAQGELTHEELDAVATRLSGEVAMIFGDLAAALDLPPGVSSVRSGWSLDEVQRGYRAVYVEGGLGGSSGIVFMSSPPAAASRGVGIQILVSTSDDETETFLLMERPVDNQTPQALALGLRDVVPELTVAAQYRVRAFVERLIGVALNLLAEDARKSLSKSGYLVDD